MKANAIVRIVLFSIAIFLLLGILGAAFLIQYNVFDLFGSNSLTLTTQETLNSGEIRTQAGSNLMLPVDDIENLDIEWAAGSILIQAMDGQNGISISESVDPNSRHNMICKQSGSTLKIEFSETTRNFSWIGINGFNANAKDLLIVVPMDWNCRKLSIDTASSDVILTNLTVDTVDFDGASGRLTFENCTAQNLDIDTASGEVSFNGSLDTLDFDATSASFSGILHNCPQQLEVDSLSGRLELFLPEECGFILLNESLSGRLNSDFEITTQGNAMVHGDGSCRIDVSGLSGDVHINKHAAASKEAPCTDDNCTDVSHNYGTTCTDENCSDASHNHGTTCTEENCTDVSHNHGTTCTDENCTDASHGHKTSHSTTTAHHSEKDHN